LSKAKEVKDAVRFIAFDLELTCERDLADYPHKIIEIGAVLFEHGKITAEFRSFVQPSPPYEVSSFCTELTGITPKQIATAEHISSVAVNFRQFIWQNKPELVISWGQSDHTLLMAECSDAKVVCPLAGIDYQNFKKVFSKHRKIKQVGLKKALEMCGIAPEGRQHSAVSDAKNLARLFMYSNVQ
jgi:3'-5' exoribonuclease 1